MSDVVVSIQAKRFSSGSGKWNFTPQAPHDNSLPTSLSIITWNIDFARPEAARRLTAALDYLRYHAFPENKGGKPPHCLILLQEININAFNTLLAHPWVREWFKVVPASPEAGRTLGNTTNGMGKKKRATWGYQPVTRYPPGRLDKILYTESDAFDVRDVRRIAVGLKMPGGG